MASVGGRARLGVKVFPVTAEVAAAQGLSAAQGVVVKDIQPGSAAERATVRVGDVILTVNATTIADEETLSRVVAANPARAALVLAVVRARQRIEMRATLDADSEAHYLAVPPPTPAPPPGPAAHVDCPPGTQRVGDNCVPTSPVCPASSSFYESEGCVPDAKKLADIPANAPKRDEKLYRLLQALTRNNPWTDGSRATLRPEFAEVWQALVQGHPTSLWIPRFGFGLGELMFREANGIVVDNKKRMGTNNAKTFGIARVWLGWAIRFPAFDKAPDALLLLAQCHNKLGDQAKAQETKRKLLSDFPNTAAAAAVGQLVP